MSGSQPASRACPRCNDGRAESETVLLQPVRDRELVIDYCRSCSGLWLDQAEWKPMVGEVRSVRRPDGITLGFRRLPCPACSAADADPGAVGVLPPGLVPRCLAIEDELGGETAAEAPSIEIDVCQCCGGAWLDRGELDEVRQAAGRLRAEIARRRAEGQAQAAMQPKLRAGVTTDPERAMTFLEALRDTWDQLWRG